MIHYQTETEEGMNFNRAKRLMARLKLDSHRRPSRKKCANGKRLKLLGLPVELLYEIIEKLNPRNLAALRLACRFFDQLIGPLMWGSMELDFAHCTPVFGKLNDNNPRAWNHKVIQNATAENSNGKLILTSHIHILLLALQILRGECPWICRIKNLTLRLPGYFLEPLDRDTYPTHANEISKSVCYQSTKYTHDWISSWLLAAVIPELCTNLEYVEVIKSASGKIEEFSPIEDFLQQLSSKKHIKYRVSVQQELSEDLYSLVGSSMKSLRLTNCDQTIRFLHGLPKTLTKLDLTCNMLSIDAGEMKSMLFGLPELQELTLFGLNVYGCKTHNRWMPETVTVFTVDCSRPLNDVRMSFPGVTEVRAHIDILQDRPFNSMSFPNIEKLYIEQSVGLWRFENQNIIMPFFLDSLKQLQVQGAKLETLYPLVKQLPSSIEVLHLSHVYIDSPRSRGEGQDLRHTLVRLTAALPNLRVLTLELSEYSQESFEVMRAFLIGCSELEGYYVHFRHFTQNIVDSKLKRFFVPVTINYVSHDWDSDLRYPVDGYQVAIKELREYLAENKNFSIPKGGNSSRQRKNVHYPYFYR